MHLFIPDPFNDLLQGSPAYLMTPAAKSKFRQTVRVATTDSEMLWSDSTAVMPFGIVNGYRAAATKQVPDDKVIFGRWDQILVARWAYAELTTDPFSLAHAGQVVVTLHNFVDIVVLQPAAFSVSTDSGAQ